jgi:hypothetical protein
VEKKIRFLKIWKPRGIPSKLTTAMVVWGSGPDLEGQLSELIMEKHVKVGC